MKPNIYTYSLKRGYETTSQGITYNTLKKEITEKFNVDWSQQFEINFKVWFFENFFAAEAEKFLKSLTVGRDLDMIKKKELVLFKNILEDKVYLKGESCLKYLDYIELIEARRTSRQAFAFSIISIIIATIAIIVQIQLGK